MRLLMLFSVLVFASPVLAAEKKEFDAKDLKSLHIENSSGKIDVHAGSGTKVTVDIEKIDFADSCKLQVEKKGTELVIDVEQPKGGLFSRKSCNVNFKIGVPKTVNVDISNGSGDLALKDMESKLVYKLGSGDVDVDAPLKDFTGKTGSGDIRMKNLVGGGEIASGSGGMQLAFKKQPSGNLTLRTGSGDIEVRLPKGSKVKTNYFSGSGDLKNELGDTPGATLTIDVKSGSGDLDIKAL